MARSKKVQQSDELMAARWASYRADPVKFAYEVCKVKKLDPWQEEILSKLATNDLIAVAAGTGVGKDYLAAVAIVWFLCVHPYAKVAATSASAQQIQVSLWMEIQKVISESPYLPAILEWTPSTIQMRGYGERWRAFQSIAAKKVNSVSGEGSAEGGQGLHAQFLFIIISEASGVGNEQFDAKLATLTDSWPEGEEGRNVCLVIGNPQKRSGRFYDIFTKSAFKQHWYTRHVSQQESSYVSKQASQRLIDMHGPDSPLVQAKVHGQFPMLAEGKTIFGYDEVEDAFKREVEDCVDWPLQIGVDVARYGSAESVIVTRRGNLVLNIEAHSRIDLMRLCSYTVTEASRWWGRPREEPRDMEPLNTTEFKQCQANVLIVVDEVGLGGGVIDVLLSQGWNAIGINNGSKAWNPLNYTSRGDELWFVDGKIALSQCAIPQCDEDLQHQLCTREVRYDRSATKRRVESKDELLRRGLPSPDRADALLLAFAAVTSQASQDYSKAFTFV